MQTAMLLDDEKPALTMLEHQLNDFPDVQVIGKYTLYRTFWKDFQKNKPDIVFADIEMPGKSGLDIAAEVKKISAHTAIVFITAHKQYAYDAYQIDACDYVLKPFTKDRLKRVLDKLKGSRSGEAAKDQDIQIRMMKRFEVIDRQEMAIHWRTRKTGELLAYLIHSGQMEINSDSIIEDLWPSEPLDRARNLLYTSVYYLRKDLIRCGMDIHVDTKGQKYVLSMNAACDVYCLENVFSVWSGSSTKNLESLFALYRGGYLEEDSYAWAKSRNLELENRLISYVTVASELFMDEKRLDKAEFALQNLVRVAPYNEYAYKLLLRVYILQNKRDSCQRLYRIYCRTMRELGVKPEPILEIENNNYI